MIGKMIGGYEILSLVGEGPNGTVWKARHPGLGKLVAIKVLPPDLALREADRERFVRGSKALARLDHPGIATVFAAEFSGTSPYIVSEFVEGQTVNAKTASGPIPADQAVDQVLQAARALQYAHERGVIHRDISGGNVMITSEGRIKIVDFGMAVERGETRMTTEGTVLGTLPYMSPEALRDAPLHESRDTYALGAVFYQLVTGRTPFAADSFERLAYHVVNSYAKPPSFYTPGLPAAVDKLVLLLLEKNPKHRATNERLIADLQVLQASRVMRADLAPTRRMTMPFVERLGRPLGMWLRQLTTMAPTQWRKLARRASVSVASISILAWAAFHLVPQGPVKPKVASLAILPFFNESAEGTFDYIGHGLAEHLAERLGGLDGLLVQPYRRMLAGDAVEMTERLNVEGVLEGSFSVRGGDVEVRVDLVKRNGRRETIVGGRYEGYKKAAEELAVAVAERLKSRLTLKETAIVGAAAAGSNEAFDALSTAVDAHQRGDREEALRWYGRAVSLDPGLAKAYVGIGSIYYDRYFRGTAGAKNLDIAQSQFEQALALDPDNAGALRGLILIHYERGEREQVFATADRVKAGGASAIDKILVPAWAYTLGGCPQDAIPLWKRASELDPQSAEALYFLVIATAWSRNFEETVRAGTEFFQRFGDDPEVHLWVAMANWGLGQESLAASHFQKAIDLFQDDTQLYVSGDAGLFFQKTGDKARAQRILSDAIRLGEARLAVAQDNLRLRSVLTGLYFLSGLDRKVKTEVAYMESLATCGSFHNGEETSVYWIASAYNVPSLRERTVRFVQDRIGPNSAFWPAVHQLKFWTNMDLLQDPRIAPIVAAARAYNDSLRQRHGLPPVKDLAVAAIHSGG